MIWSTFQNFLWFLHENFENCHFDECILVQGSIGQCITGPLDKPAKFLFKSCDGIRINKTEIKFQGQWWDSNFIPRFTKIFKYWKNFSVIVFGIKNSAFSRNLSPYARSRAEKSHQTFRSLRLGEVPFKISFLENAWCHRNQR